MANIKDVAERAGVSVATVSRVLNGNSPVAETRERVLAAVKELGYRPNNVARALRTARTGTLGLVISDLTNPFFTELADAVEDAARGLGYSLVIGNAGERPAQQDDYIRTLLDRRIDGLLVSSAGTGSAMLGEVVASGTPLVLLDRTVPGIDAPCVRADGRAALTDLAAHLAALGRRRPRSSSPRPAPHRRRAPGTLPHRPGRPRHRPARQARRCHPDLQPSGGRRVMRDFLDLPEPPDAVLATDNLMALGAMDELRARGLRVPDDVALVVYDDVPWFAHTDPPLTAIAQPTRDLGRAAVQTLLARIEGRPAPDVLLPAHLVPRRSCGEPPTPDRSRPTGTGTHRSDQPARPPGLTEAPPPGHRARTPPANRGTHRGERGSA
ncbi:substrate-binding domain-containing protein [Streptomyces albulus]|nr:substrate-binding domain-containing protein [Streptomyces noursei]